MLLDTPVCTEEVADAVKKLKAGKAPGSDGLLVEHLKCQDSLLVWLQSVMNFIVESEAVQSVLKAWDCGGW